MPRGRERSAGGGGGRRRRGGPQHPAAGFRYLHHPRANKSAALNAALAEVPDDALVVFFDDDVRVDPGVLETYAEAARGTERAFFGGTTRVDYETPPPAWLVRALPLSARGMDVGAADWPGWFLGFNWAARAGDLRAVGGFDPDVGPGSPTGALGQETTMQNVLKAAGLVAVPVPAAAVWHYVPARRASQEWVIRRRYQLGVSGGRAIALGRRRNTIPREVATAVRSLVLLPLYLLVRSEPRVAFHKMVVSRAAGLLRGYVPQRLDAHRR